MRIVAGAARGRRLAVPAEGTRPTSDRAREAMFNTLTAMLDLDGLRVLDLYAGSGAVGLEALSRGAAAAVLVERSRPALTVLRRNVETVGLPGAVVVGRPVASYLASEPPDPPFGLVFADPPYAVDDDTVASVLARLGDGGWLASGAVVVVERSARRPPQDWTGTHATAPSRTLTRTGERRYGDSLLWYGRAR